MNRAGRLRGVAALAELERALALCTGDLFETDASWEWAGRWREEYRRRFVSAAADAAALALSLGDAQRAVSLYQAILERDPLDENAARALMRRCARMHDVNGVRRVYRQLCEAVRRGLGDHASPGPETARLLSELLADVGVE